MESISKIKSAAIAIALISGIHTVDAQKVRIGVKDASFTKSLIENLASEYNKVNGDVVIEVVNTADADANVELSDNEFASVGRFIVLPIANSENEILANKKIRKGVNGKVGKEIFVQPTYEEALEAEEDGEKPLPGTVYTLSGSKAYITRLFAEKLNASPAQLKGKKILGREENILAIVKQKSDAISFNVANLIYDLSDRHPQAGISVLSVDLDGNGRVSDEEREALESIDSLTDYVSKIAKPFAPVGDIVIESDNKVIKDFVSWAQLNGQDIVANQGFLGIQSSLLTAQR